jgi:FtsH ternary system domain X7
MIFQFPDLDTFRLAVTSAQVPPEVAAGPAEVAFDPQGRPSVRSVSGIPPKPMQNALKKLGVRQGKEHYSEAVLTVECWPQVLPVSKVGVPPEVTTNTPVLFEMPVDDMPAVVTEMLRLGNDRQSFRTLAPAKGKGERILLKVIGPPYYTLLRAIDKTTQAGATVTAYVEKAARIWVELGYDHPLAGQLKPADGQVLLLRPEREWTAVEDGPFQDVYEVLDFKVPAASVEWQESHLKGKLAVPLRLVPGNAADVPELWVLTEEAIDQLDALVRDADERLMARLSFAVALEPDGKTTIVLKTRPSKLSPPVLPLAKARGFKPYWKLPNLFLPAGKRLMPTLRRDAVRKLLADDPAQVVWLMPGPDGKFTPEVLPDDAFRPLEDWIDYVIDHEHEPLQSWVQATHFDFESFVCRDEEPGKPKPPPDKGRKTKKGDRDEPDEDVELPPAAPRGSKKKASATADDVEFLVPVEAAPPNELKVKLRALEDQFKAIDGPLDAPDRIALWPQIAQLNAALKDTAEAAICWTNAFWELPAIPAEGSWVWLRSEDPEARRVPTAEEWEDALAAKLPSPNEVRAFAARVVHACRQDPGPESFLNRLPKAREYLEHHEGMLGVRAVWLTWWHLARVGGQADILALARVRDRLLQRLLAEGLNKERDLPYFLRTAGEQNSERMRLVRDRAVRVHRLVEKWHAGEDVKVNKPYVDLMFAFGFAKLGEVTKARDLLKNVEAKLLEPVGPKDRPDPAHEFLFKAFYWRIENALQGKPHAGPLPAEMLARLERIDEGRGTTLGWSYPINRLREQSRILEPQETLDPYAPWKKFGNDLQKILSDLANVKDASRLEAEIKKLVRTQQTAGGDRLLVFAEVVPLAPRVGEEFTVALIQQVPAVLDLVNKVTGPPDYLGSVREKQTRLLERSLFLAAHYDRTELVQTLFGRFLEFVRARTGTEMYEAINKIARECLRSLRKLGLKNEIERFLSQMTDLVVQGKSLPALQAAAGATWPDVLRVLLQLAEGYLFFGGFQQAKPFLDAARNAIFDNTKAGRDKGLKPLQLTKLVQAYVAALGQGPVDEALNRIEELFQQLEKLPNTFTSAPYFSRLHLNIVEEVVRALVSDNMALGDQARRWLDDDEYLVRRRIHGDMRKLLASHGL